MQGLRVFLLATTVFTIGYTNACAGMPPELKIGEHVLRLNGEGARTKTFITVYESGLYLLTPSRDAKAIVDADKLMTIRVKITSGFVSQSALVESLTSGLKSSTGGNLKSIEQETIAFLQCMQGEIQKNDVFDFVYVPGRGLVVVKNAVIKGTVPGIDFKRALFGIWLSDSPIDADLRQAMLSGAKVR